uniref:Uncharacterized protein n=1 Tax=Oryza meridionalis TaxID=40149 RepID=A0A0E0ELW8_9ORYZ
MQVRVQVQAKTEYQERKFSDMYRDRSLCKDLNQGQRIVIKRRRRGLIEQFTQISSARFALKAPVLFALAKNITMFIPASHDCVPFA